MPRWPQVKKGILWFGLLMPLALYGVGIVHRPNREVITRQALFRGIVYSRRVVNQPRPQIIHIIDIDLRAPGLKLLVTPGYEGTEVDPSDLQPWATVAKRTSEFLEAEGLQLAINANFFYPFREVTLWNYQPRSGQLANMTGLAISNGKVISSPQTNTESLCFIEQQATIRSDGTCPSGTQQAVAGILMLLQQGQATEQAQQKQLTSEGKKPYSFTVAALDASGTRLWLVLVDGKQPLYSEGMTIEEMIVLLQELGADTAVRLDGGGSTTLAMASPAGPQVLNAPIHAKVPGQERPVANHLGFFAQPLEPEEL